MDTLQLGEDEMSIKTCIQMEGEEIIDIIEDQ